jgi:hypothetical protein
MDGSDLACFAGKVARSCRVHTAHGTQAPHSRSIVMKQLLDSFCDDLAGIARYEVSEDGVAWRPYNPKEDVLKALHKRIEFADIDGAEASCMAAHAS